MRCCLTEKREL